MELNQIEDPEVQAAIHEGIRIRLQAWKLETEAKAMRAAADELLKPVLLLVEDNKAVAPGYGTVSFVVSERNTLDKKKFKLELVKLGTPVGAIEAAEKLSTKTTTSDSVRFVAEKVDD